jgi:tetratricopeptide (TPR) repeat protein
MSIGNLEDRLVAGDWTTLLADLVRSEHGQNAEDRCTVKTLQALLRARSGEVRRLRDLLDEIDAFQGSVHSQGLVPYVLITTATAELTLGDTDAAVERLRSWASTPTPGSTVEYAWLVPDAVRTALACGARDLAQDLRHRGDGRLPVQEMVMQTVACLETAAQGEDEAACAGFAEAARRWRDFGVPYEEAHAWLGAGRCLTALGRGQEAAALLAAAGEIFARLGAKPALAEVDALRRSLEPPSH